MHEIVKRTWRTDLPHNNRLANAALGLAGEAGEVADLIKKMLFHGHKINEELFLQELGDVYFYLSAIELELGLTREQAQDAVNAKLQKRYPTGFDPMRSINRDAVNGGSHVLNSAP